jgi:acetylornithine deacetylase/succinyl-diaminopimelate desuccinylase-like protein
MLVYGHYDVQPVEPLDAWESAPFDPMISGDRIVGRGSADDKGQILIQLDAVAALLRRGPLPLNIRFLFEGEEESDAEHLEEWIVDNRHRLDADFAVVSDTGFFDGDLPAITVGLRGFVGARIVVNGAPFELHSGTHGGVAPNPALGLAQLLADLRDADGRVTLPNFYDGVTDLPPGLAASLRELPFDERAYLDEIGITESVGEDGYSLLERRGTRPTFEVHSLTSGYQGDGLKTVIPTSAEATVSFRLVAGQRTAAVLDALDRHITANTPAGLTSLVEDLGQGSPVALDTQHPLLEVAAAAYESSFGRAPVLVWEGGSIPACEAIDRVLGVPVLLLGFTPPNCGTHAPNEWMSLDHYERGVSTMMKFIQGAAARAVRNVDGRTRSRIDGLGESR